MKKLILYLALLLVAFATAEIGKYNFLIFLFLLRIESL